MSAAALQLVSEGVQTLWRRIVTANPLADCRPLLLSYDVHPTPVGPVLIEVNTNAGGVLTAMQAARNGNECCADWEHAQLERRLLNLFRHDLLGKDIDSTGIVAIVDDDLSNQPLLPEMRAIAELIRPHARDVLIVDAAELTFSDGRLRHGEIRIDRVYWRSTDFLLIEPVHSPVLHAIAANAVLLAPSPEAYQAIADKRLFIEWSKQPELAHDEQSGASFCIAETVPTNERLAAEWYATRNEWVFKPASGYGSRGVYVGKSISRHKLEQLPFDQYLAQRYTPHPVIDRDGMKWKYDVRFFADRGEVIGAVARIFQGQVVGMRAPGSGFAPMQMGNACCLIGAMAAASLR